MNTLNIVDALIIIVLLLATINGFKRGFIRGLVSLVGNIIVLILSYKFMGPLASVFYKYVPFFDSGFFGISITSLNILLFQIIAFALCFIFFTLILNMIETITSIADKLIDNLIIFKALSSFLGMIVGFISGYIAVFVILLIISVPFYNSEYLYKSTFANFIINKTPILASSTKSLRSARDDIYRISTEINDDKNYKKHSSKYDYEVFESLLKYKVITYDNAKTLKEQDKLNNIKGVSKLIEKYK